MLGSYTHVNVPSTFLDDADSDSMRQLSDKITQEDVNGEKLTMKKWWIFGADFSRFTQSFSRFIRDIDGEKNISLLR